MTADTPKLRRSQSLGAPKKIPTEDLRAQVRAALGEDASDQEELILALSAAELKELLAEMSPKPAKAKKKSQPKKERIDVGAVPEGEVTTSAAKPRRRAGCDADRPEEATSELVFVEQVKQGRHEKQTDKKPRPQLDVEEAPSAPEPATLVSQGRRARPTGLRPTKEPANDEAPSAPEPPPLTSSGRRVRPLVPRARTVSPNGRRAAVETCPSDAPQTPATISAAAARAGAGARAFAKKTKKGERKREEVTPAVPLQPAVRLELAADDDSDFDGTGGSGETRALLEGEVTQLCERQDTLTPAAAAVAAATARGGAGVAEVESRMAEMTAERAKEQEDRYAGLTEEQKVNMAYVEDLELKSELHFKAKLHGLTQLETAELFQQHGLDAPKDGDFGLTQRMMADRQSRMTIDFRKSIQNSKGRAKTRYVDGEAVETKDKYIWERKETHESIRATTCNILLIGNSSKARRDHRTLDEIKQKTGPVSNTKPKKKKTPA